MLPDQLAANESIHNAGRRNGSSTPVAVAATNPSNSYEFVVCRIIGRDENDNDDAWIRYKFFPEFDELASWNKNAKDVVTFDFHISNIEMIQNYNNSNFQLSWIFPILSNQCADIWNYDYLLPIV